MEYTPKDKKQAIKLVSKRIIENVYNTILLEMRFIDVALARLKPKPSAKVDYLGTNGKYLYYNEKRLIKEYKTNPTKVAHDIIHTLLHCVFMHIFNTKTEQYLFNIASDIAVEQLISTINIPSLRYIDNTRLQAIKQFEEHVKPFTAANVVRFLKESNSSDEDLAQLSDLFYVDQHRYWVENINGGDDDNESEGGSDGDGDGDGNGDGENDDFDTRFNGMSKEQLKKMWEKVSGTVELNMESFSKMQGDKAGDLRQQLKQLNREKYDYSKFLRKFAQRQEETKVNPDEFDYVFYTYGLNLYENMPLIEPLEYKDTYLITDFVIAIDTSGSTSGEVVQNFLQKTYNILKSTESFARKINLCIIQCDALIQEIIYIKSIEEFDEYIQNFQIKGLGGTDFRPVFALVNELVREKVFTKLKGLIYFTDGYGTFPAQKTAYDTAFVFIVKEDYENVTVPPWAMKVLLTENEIKEFSETNFNQF